MLWGEMGGTLKAPASRRPGPQAVPQTRAFGLCDEKDAPGPREELSRRLRRSGAAGQSREPRETAGARGRPPLPADAVSRRLWALQPPPGHPEGEQGGKQHNRGGSSAPVSCRDRSGFLSPRDNGKQGEKRVKKLG